MNALLHGRYAKSEEALRIIEERKREKDEALGPPLEDIEREMVGLFKPENPLDRRLVNRVAVCLWRLERTKEMERREAARPRPMSPSSAATSAAVPWLSVASSQSRQARGRRMPADSWARILRSIAARGTSRRCLHSHSISRNRPSGSKASHRLRRAAASVPRNVGSSPRSRGYHPRVGPALAGAQAAGQVR